MSLASFSGSVVSCYSSSSAAALPAAAAFSGGNQPRCQSLMLCATAAVAGRPGSNLQQDTVSSYPLLSKTHSLPPARNRRGSSHWWVMALPVYCTKGGSCPRSGNTHGPTKERQRFFFCFFFTSCKTKTELFYAWGAHEQSLFYLQINLQLNALSMAFERSILNSDCPEPSQKKINKLAKTCCTLCLILSGKLNLATRCYLPLQKSCQSSQPKSQYARYCSKNNTSYLKIIFSLGLSTKKLSILKQHLFFTNIKS